MTVSVTQLVVRNTVMMAAIWAALFLPAGTFAWMAGWAFFLLMSAYVIAISVWLLHFNPELLRERLTGIGRPDQKRWDKVFLGVMAVAFFAWFVLMGLDAVRYRWSRMPAAVQFVGALLLLISFYIFYRTFRENSFLSPAVRIQRERGQTVVSTGPYRYVRHPLYAGFIQFCLGTALLLGSWLGTLGGLLLIGMVAWRAVQEERLLERELNGYNEYMKRVRYRFVPHVW
jgi:protein-S-isoprenylcysteine O-methyltransferase Ste14